MNMPSTACARHGALYVMVDTWAKVDAHALILALTLTLTLTPNAKSPTTQSDCINGNTSLCVYGGDYDREQQGSTAPLGAPAAAAGRLPARVALSRAHCGLALWDAEPNHGRLGPRGAQPSSLAEAPPISLPFDRRQAPGGTLLTTDVSSAHSLVAAALLPFSQRRPPLGEVRRRSAYHLHARTHARRHAGTQARVHLAAP